MALAEKLKAPMSAQSQQLKQYMADTVLPAITQVKQVHDTLEDERESICTVYTAINYMEHPSGHGLRYRPFGLR